MKNAGVKMALGEIIVTTELTRFPVTTRILQVQLIFSYSFGHKKIPPLDTHIQRRVMLNFI